MFWGNLRIILCLAVLGAIIDTHRIFLMPHIAFVHKRTNEHARVYARNK